jgi:uncharacterized protein (DUF302 family)
MLKRAFILANLLFVASCACRPAPEPVNGEWRVFYQAETTKPYDEVLSELESAIAEQNFRITGHSRVGKVIRERGAEGFPEYDTVQFCNLTHAKTLLEMSPHAISYMPCNVVTYQFNGKTIIKTHLLPENGEREDMNQFAKEMNQKIKSIVDFAAQQ